MSDRILIVDFGSQFTQRRAGGAQNKSSNE
jgi:hypothetical protein